MPAEPRVLRNAHPALRAQLRGPYTAWTRPDDRSGRFVLSATTSVALVVKLEDSPVRPPQFLRGVDTSFAVLDGGCAPQYIELAMSPLGAYQLLGVPMSELAGELVDLYDVVGEPGWRLGEMVRNAATWKRRFELLDRFFLHRMAGPPRVAPEVARAWHRLAVSGGTVAIRNLCTDVGWSHKHLIARFRQQVGVTPKQAARLIRFERVVRRMSRDPEPDWGIVAAEYGYADQAHLIRDFGRFAGTTPAAAVGGRRRPVNFVQAPLREAS